MGSWHEGIFLSSGKISGVEVENLMLSEVPVIREQERTGGTLNDTKKHRVSIKICKFKKTTLTLF